jgi:hypothetical protein
MRYTAVANPMRRIRADQLIGRRGPSTSHPWAFHDMDELFSYTGQPRLPLHPRFVRVIPGSGPAHSSSKVSAKGSRLMEFG